MDGNAIHPPDGEKALHRHGDGNPVKMGKGLNRQLAFLLIGMSAAFAVLSFATLRIVILPVFGGIEYESAERDIKRTIGALQRDIEQLSDFVNDWAAWDSTYTYIQGKNPAFADENLIDESYTNSNLNLIALFDENRRLVWGEGRDLETEEKVDFSEALAQLSDPANTLTHHKDAEDAKHGVLMTRLGPLLLAARPIITSKREGPVRGSLVMARLLSPDEIASLAERVQLDLKIASVEDEDLPDAERALLATADRPTVLEEGSEKLHAYQAIPDLFGEPALLVRVDVERTITAQGKVAANVAILLSIAGGFLMMAGAGWLIRRRVVGPVRQMAEHAQRVGEKGNLKSRLGFTRDDEIGALATAFDAMVEAIAESRKQLLDTAHRAGMADVASEVLHNVGNAVNSANASLEKLEERAGQSKLEGLEKAVDLLQAQSGRAADFFGHDPRGPKLIEYFAKVTESLQGEFADTRQNLDRLRETLRHIRGVIALQQANARQTHFVQEVELRPLIEEALTINQPLIHSTSVEVEVRAPDLPEMNLNKSKLSQVLVNLIKNATEAMREQPGTRRLTITAAAVEKTGLGIEVRDTGAGIAEADRQNLFNQGFTTKADGNGIGLHFCANAVRSMGGQIAVLSDGPGHGAAIRIWLPGVIPAEGGQETPEVPPATSRQTSPHLVRAA